MPEQTVAVEQVSGVEPATTILVVAESAFVRLRSAALFRENGFTVVEAATSADALTLYATAQPQAVVLDGSTLEGHGLPAVRAIMSLDPAAKVAMVTAQARQEMVLEAARMGVRDFIVKPYDASRLLQAARTLVAPATERRHVRAPVSITARIGFGTTPGAYYSCLIEDLSVGGARCNLTSAGLSGDPAVGTIAQLKFTLPDRQGLVLAVGRLARLIAPDVFAVAFAHLSRSHSDRIEAFCQRVLQENAASATGSAHDRSRAAPDM